MIYCIAAQYNNISVLNNIYAIKQYLNKNNQQETTMRNKLLISICSTAFIAFSAYAADMNGDDGVMKVPAQSVAPMQDNNSAMMAAPAVRKLPVARDGEIIDSVGSGATEPVLTSVQTSDGINYITGGVGDEELAVLKAQEDNYNAHLLLTSMNGEYMGDVALNFLDKQGNEVLKVDSAGPLFYVNLPAGTYNVEATSSSGLIQKAKLTAGAKASKGKVVIRFKE